MSDMRELVGKWYSYTKSIYEGDTIGSKMVTRGRVEVEALHQSQFMSTAISERCRTMIRRHLQEKCLGPRCIGKTYHRRRNDIHGSSEAIKPMVNVEYAAYSIHLSLSRHAPPGRGTAGGRERGHVICNFFCDIYATTT